MDLDIGGFTNKPDWPKLGPSLLIATCLILAIRTAKWGTQVHKTARSPELDEEIDFAAHIAGRVLSRLISKYEPLFPQRKEAWYKPDGKDCPD
jgi:hypothetical protein